MSKIVKASFSDDLTYTVDCLAEKKEYEDFKDRITDQFLKNVEVKGFRKGKAPRDLAMKNVDQIALQQTVLEESIEKFYGEVQSEVSDNLKEKNRIPANTPAQIDPASIKEEEDGFHFSVKVSLLPEIDLDTIAKIKIAEPTEKDIDNRVSKKEFFNREKENLIASLNSFKPVDRKAKKGDQVMIDLVEKVDGSQPNEQKAVKVIIGRSQFPEKFESNLIGLKAGESKDFSADIPHGNHAHSYDFSVTCHEVAEPEFTKIDDVLAHSDETKDRFKNEKEFEEFLTNIYDQETQQLLNSLKRRAVIKTVIEKVKDFALPEADIEKEASRIYNTLEARAIEGKTTIADVFKASGLPKAEDGLKKDDDVKKAVEDYVRKEFKLVEILRTAYQIKVSPKDQGSRD
jgi:trigger factor